MALFDFGTRRNGKRPTKVRKRVRNSVYNTGYNPGYNTAYQGEPQSAPAASSTKHNFYKDFGYLHTLGFRDYQSMYQRNDYAHAAVELYSDKCFESYPELRYQDESEYDTVELDVKHQFKRLRLWQLFADADRGGLVGGWAACILRVRDGLPLHLPVGPIQGGLNGLVEVIPVWQDQITIESFVDEVDIKGGLEDSDNLGKPKIYQYTSYPVAGTNTSQVKQDIHHSRIVLFSRDGTIYSVRRYSERDLTH